MTRTADRKLRQPPNNALTVILMEQFNKATNADDLRSRLLELEIRDDLPCATAMAVRACIEILAHQLDHAAALLDGAAAWTNGDDQKGVVLHVRALLAMQRGDNPRALQLALEALWLRSDPHLWALFLMVADQTQRPDVVEATLRGLASANFLNSEELRDTLAGHPMLNRIRGYEAYRFEVAPRVLPKTGN